MDIILINTMSTGLYDSIKYFLFNKKDKNIIIDPFSCIIKLGLLSYQNEGTKISIIDNQINFNGPNVGQGIIRYLYGDGREDLHNLFKPIQKSVEWYKERDFTDIAFLFERAKVGMLVLKKSYGKFLSRFALLRSRFCCNKLRFFEISSSRPIFFCLSRSDQARQNKNLKVKRFFFCCLSQSSIFTCRAPK